MVNKLILLVEDNDVEAMLMGVALRKNGVTADVTRAKDGVEALDILFPAESNGTARFSVVFLDLNLPRVSGLEVLERIRSEDRMCMLPIIVLSSSAREEDVRNAYRLGANSYVRKAVNFDEFSGAVKQLTSYWLSLNEPAPLWEVRPAGSKEIHS
jgi:two-component system response regulator